MTLMAYLPQTPMGSRLLSIGNAQAGDNPSGQEPTFLWHRPSPIEPTGSHKNRLIWHVTFGPHFWVFSAPKVIQNASQNRSKMFPEFNQKNVPFARGLRTHFS